MLSHKKIAFANKQPTRKSTSSNKYLQKKIYMYSKLGSYLIKDNYHADASQSN